MFRIYCFLLCFLGISAAFAQVPVSLFNMQKIDALKKEYSENHGQVSKEYQTVLKVLVKSANSALSSGTYSIVDKSQIPPSGDKHDYLSLGKYYWPDSSKPDGLPYIQKDGVINPETGEIPDKKLLDKMRREVSVLSVAYYVTGKEEFGKRAQELFSVWMIDTATKMNPNLNSAQIKKGYKGLLYSGIIDAADMAEVVDAAAILQNAGGFTQANFLAVKTWFRDYYTWLTTSKSGVRESQSKNNHGTWYDTQVLSLAIFLGETEAAKKICEEAKEKRFSYQIEPDGSQPEELRRTLSINYSCFNLTALAHFARIAENIKVDLWNYSAQGRGSLKTAFDYMMPYFLKEKEWGHKQIKEFAVDSYAESFMWATERYGDARYRDVVLSMLNKPYATSLKSLFF